MSKVRYPFILKNQTNSDYIQKESLRSTLSNAFTFRCKVNMKFQLTTPNYDNGIFYLLKF